jgi:RNA polymerase sigma factor (sigma-70 family)
LGMSGCLLPQSEPDLFEFFERIRPIVKDRVARYRSRIRCMDDEDLLHEGYLAAIEAARSYKPKTGGARIDVWVWLSVDNRMRSLAVKHPELLLEENDLRKLQAGKDSQQSWEASDLRACMALLPGKEQAVLQSLSEKGSRGTDVARTLGVTKQRVYQLKNAAVEQIADTVTRSIVCSLESSDSKEPKDDSLLGSFKSFCHSAVSPELSILRKYFGTMLMEEFARRFFVKGGSLYVRTDDALELVHSVDPGHAREMLTFPLRENSVYDYALKTRRPLLIESVGENQVRSSGWDGYDDGSVLVCPIPGDGEEPIGVFCVYNKKKPPFTEEDIGLCSELSSFVEAN